MTVACISLLGAVTFYVWHARDDGEALAELPEYLIGWRYGEQSFRIDLPNLGIKCTESFRQQVLSRGGVSEAGVPRLVNPEQMGVRTPSPIKQIAAARWRVLGANSVGNTALLTLTPYLESYEHNGPCWVLAQGFSDFATAIKQPSVRVVIQRADIAASKITWIAGKPTRHPTLTTNVVDGSLAQVIFSRAGVKKLLAADETASSVWVISGYQKLRARVSGVAHQFESVFFRQVPRADSSEQIEVAKVWIHSRTGTICSRHRMKEDGWFESYVLGLVDPPNAGDQLWLVENLMYEGDSLSLEVPVLDGGRCRLKTIATTSYRGL